jgi:tetratricopeptide (TPR) repeat protein
LDGYEPVRQSVELFNAFGNNGITIFLSKPAVVFRDRPAAIDAADPDIVDVSQMKENFPKKALQSFEKAVEEKSKGRFESAVKLLQEAVKLAPNFFHAHNNLGIVYHALKRYSEAEQEFKRSRQLNAKSERPLVNLGSLYIEQANQQKNREETGKLLDQALDALEEAVKLNPRSSLAHLLLGQANYRSGFYEEAELAFKRAQYLDPHLGVARLMLANVYVRLQKWDQVLEHLDAYLKENPKAADYASVEEMRGRVARSLQATHEHEAAQ